MREAGKIVYFLFAVGGYLFADVETDNFLRSVQKSYQSLKSVCAEFTQTFHWKLTGEVQTLSGRVCSLDGNQFRIETPDQLIVTNGKVLWTFTKANNQVVIDRPENATSDNPFIKEFLDKYLTEYTAQPAASDAEGMRCVLMKAKSEDQYVTRMKLWIDEKSRLIRKIEQTDVNDNITLFEVKNIDTSVKLTPRDFNFTPPDGADVIDMR
ncbi:MAG: outer membrane lipoprotein carrier protein LolA [candidate division KSB1 bacterium]|nr:outer membrane lipoprotein carrier protein LolA [candidate division KSB1 bacterium]